MKAAVRHWLNQRETRAGLVAWVILIAGIIAIFQWAPRIDASGVWPHHPIAIQSPFYRAWLTHRGCGKEPSGPITYGYYGAAHQKFSHCTMTFSRVFVHRLGTTATPRPTHTPLPTIPVPPTVGRTPSPVSTHLASATPTVAPRSTDTPVVPTNTALPPTPQPIPTAAPPSDAASYELYLMNQTRSQYGLPPYSINATESNGTATCPGSYGHSVHMSQTGVLAHDQFGVGVGLDICVPVRAAGENIGYSSQFGNAALDSMHQQMMAEQHDAAFCSQFSNHACSIISPTYTQVGIGIYTANGVTWLTVDFLG